MKGPVLLFILGFTLMSGKSGVLKVGDAAPDFTLPDENESLHTLSEYRGQRVVVYFYPKDDTPGCIKEACGIRDIYSEFEESNIKVFGISYDSPRSHKKFKEKYQLPFTLLSDTNKEVSKVYGAKGLFFPNRITFLIDEQGTILKVYEKVSVTKHGEDVLQYFSSSQP